MNLRRGCLLALALGCVTGCRQLFGFEDPIVGVDTAAVTYEVTGTYRQRYGGNDAAFRPQIMSRIRPVSEVTMSVSLSDGVSRPVEYRSDGTFSFVRSEPEEPYQLSLGDSSEYQHTASHLEIGVLSPGRLGPTPVTQSTLVKVTLGPQPSGFPYVVTTGVWGQYNPPVGAGVGSFNIDWRNVTGIPPFGLLDQTKNDRLYIGYVETVSGVQPYIALTRVYETRITQLDGGTVNINGIPQTPFTRSYCVREQARRADAMTRVRTALPMFPTLAAEYRISAAPQANYPFLPNLVLAYDVTTGGSDANLDVYYGNPFPGTQVLSGIVAVGTRDVLVPGTGVPLQLRAVGLQTYQLEMTTTCPVSMPVLDVGIASVPSLAGVALTIDRAQLVIPGGDPLEITWQLGSPGPVDYTNVAISVVDTTQSPPTLREVHRIYTTTTSVTVPRTLFMPDRYYVIGLQTVSGVPGAATGDFETMTYPTGWFLTQSSPFQVGG